MYYYLRYNVFNVIQSAHGAQVTLIDKNILYSCIFNKNTDFFTVIFTVLENIIILRWLIKNTGFGAINITNF